MGTGFQFVKNRTLLDKEGECRLHNSVTVLDATELTAKSG